ncbi:MAG: MFS transporter [Segniliparus sp.]|uniref:MFS transporter n=1 Tax=Segniliparus sp. TaxID=2804064 RepID=UPI003F359380
MTRPESVSTSEAHDKQARKVVWGALVGTALEWYDFFLFGTASALVFNEQFFAKANPAAAALSSFATLAVGFVARPLGGVVFGRMGDKIGRRTTLMVTITLIGFATGLIGLLPNFASIGVWSAVGLTALRFVQGLALGGEWAGAIVMTAEHAPPRKRALYTALPLIGSPLGTLASSGAFLAVGMLPKSSFDAWGWRVPFVAAFGLLLVVVHVRSKLDESPVFQEVQAAKAVHKAPVAAVLRTSWRQVLVGAMASLVGMGGFFLVTTFVISYAKRELHMSASILLLGTLVAAFGEILVIVGFGFLAQKTGAPRIAAGGALACVALAFPLFWLFGTGDPLWTVLAMTVGVAALSTPYAVCGTIMAALYPDNLRYTGVALSANLAAILSGFVPFVATWLLRFSDNQTWSSALLFAAMGAITWLGAVLAPRAQAPAAPSLLRPAPRTGEAITAEPQAVAG